MGDTAISRRVRQSLLRRRQGSQGLPTGRPQGPGERFVRGAVSGFTAPLDIFGLSVEPQFGPEGPGIAGTAGGVAGSIAPFLLLEAAIARAIPILAGGGALSSGTRTGATFGLLGAGREPEPGETRAGNFASEAVVGSIFGAGIRPGVSAVRGAATGAAAGITPVAFGKDPLAPVDITGEPIPDSLIFNALLGAVLSRLGRRVSSEQPPIPDTIPQPPGGGPELLGPARIRGLLPRGTIITPDRPPKLLPPARTEFGDPRSRIMLDAGTEAGPAVTPTARRILEHPPFGRRFQPGRFQQRGQLRLPSVVQESLPPREIPEFARPAEPLTNVRRPLNRSQLEILSVEAVRQDTNIGRQLIRPGVYIDLGSGVGSEIRPGHIGLDISKDLPSGGILAGLVRGSERVRVPGILHDLNRKLPFEPQSVDAFNLSQSLTNLKPAVRSRIVTDIDKSLRQGGLVTITDDTKVLKQVVPRFKAAGFEVVERTYAGADIADVQQVAVTFRKPIVQPGQTKASVPRAVEQKPTIIETRTVDEEAALGAEIAARNPVVSEKRGRRLKLEPSTAERIREISIERPIPGFDGVDTINTAGLSLEQIGGLRDFARTLGDAKTARSLGATMAGLQGGVSRARPKSASPRAKREIEMVYDQQTLDAAVDVAESSAIVDTEIGPMVRQLLDRTRKMYNQGVLRQGETSAAYTYADYIRQAKAGNMVPRGMIDGKLELVMPDKSIKRMTMDEFKAFIEPMMPETTVVPVTRGPDLPPREMPIADVPPIHHQLELPFGRTPRPPKKAPKVPESSADVELKASRDSVRLVGEGTTRGLPKQSLRRVSMKIELPPTPAGRDLTVTRAGEGLVTVSDDAFQRYRASVVDGETILDVRLVGSQARAGRGRDVDVVHVLNPKRLPKNPSEIDVELFVESQTRLNLDQPGVDMFFQVDDKVFRLFSGAGREIARLPGRAAKDLLSLRPRSSGGRRVEFDTVQALREAIGEKIAELKRPPPVPEQFRIERIRPLVETHERLPAKARAEFVKGEGRAKAIDVNVTANDGIIIENMVTGERVTAKNTRQAAEIINDSANNTGPTIKSDELRSLFRRRFAGAKNNVERNNIRNKYRQFEPFFPRAGEGVQPGETPLRSLRGKIDAKRPPVVDLTPPGVPGGIGLPPGQSPTPLGGGSNPPGFEFWDMNRIKRLGWEGYMRIFKQWALSTEGATKGAVPAFSKIFMPLDGGRQQMQKFLAPFYDRVVKAWKLSGKGAEASKRVSLFMEAKDKAAAIKEFGITPGEVRAGEILRDVYNDAFKAFDFVDDAGRPLKSAQYLEDYVPRRRANPEHGRPQIRQFTSSGRPSQRYYDFYAEHPRRAEVFDFREMNAFKLMNEHLFLGARKKFLADAHRNAVEFFNGLTLPAEAQGIRGHLAHFIDRMWGGTDESLRAVNSFVEGTLGSLKILSTNQMRSDFTSVLLQLGVGAHIAWRVPLVVRNTFQTMFAYPMLGEKYFAIGLKRAMTKRGWAEVVKDGVVGEEAIPFGDEIFNPFSTLTQLIRGGTKAYRRVDDFTRAVAHLGTKARIMDAGLRLRQGKINVAGFERETELLSMLHPVEAKLVLDSVRAGRIEGAAKLAGNLVQENTNFIYRSGNAPGSFRGVAGRLFGQFGIWPLSYVEYVRYLAAFGTPAQRAAKLTRFIGMNTAFGTAGTLLGVNTWKWVMFGPIVFTGGPILDVVQDLAALGEGAATGRTDDPEFNLALERTKRQLPGAFVPGTGLIRDIERTIESLQRGGAGEAATTLFTGQQPEIPLELGSQSPQQRREISRKLREALQRRKANGRQ